MQKYYNNVISSSGKPVQGASVLVVNTATGANATIYSDNGVTQTTNPLTTDVNGLFSFYADVGRYSLTVTANGQVQAQFTDIIIEDYLNNFNFTVTNPVGTWQSTTNAYNQLAIQNKSSGISASADFIAYPNNGADAHGWVDVGINSSGYADTTYTTVGANESYLLASAPVGSTGTGNLVLGTDNTGTANAIQFYTGGFTQAKNAYKMQISSTGVAVQGTLSATGILSTNNSATSVNYSFVQNSGATIYMGAESSAGGVFVAGSSPYSTGIRSTGVLNFSTNNGASAQATLDTSGNLGLGVTPSAWNTNGRAYDLQFGALYSFNGGSINLSNNAYFNAGGGWTYKNTAAASRYFQSTGVHSWFTAPSGTADTPVTFTQAMTLDASGNLGLGVTPSAWSGAGAKAIEVGGPGNGILANSSAIEVFQNTYYASGWKYASSVAASYYQQSSGAHAWYTAPSGTAGNPITWTQSLQLGKGTALTLEGGTSTAGTGIAFPATQLASTDPNTLDDYKEGTWTPTQGAGLTVVGAFSSSGTYTKIGRQVTVNGQVNGVTSVAASGSTVLCGGLPYSAPTATLGSCTNASVSVAGVVATSGTNLVSTAISATTTIYFTLTYFV